MAVRREASVKGSGLLETSKSLEKTKQDEDVVVRGHGKEKSRGRSDIKKRVFEPGNGHSGSDRGI